MRYFVVAACLALMVRATAGEELFPCPAGLVNNVAFWKKIYTEYDSRQFILHDYEQILVIYDVMKTDSDSPRILKKIFQQKRSEYQSILELLSQGEVSTDEEKRIWELWGPGATAEDFIKAKDNMRFQRGQRDKYLAGLKRSGRYLEKIKDIFRRHDVPERLIYLPHVESSFNYKARSFRGAAGIWQFMRHTGRLFLRIDYLVDQRMDPLVSAEAAAKLLRRNFERLGTWPLAVTAYNHGVNGMERAVAELGTTDIDRIIEEHKGRSFRFASRNFYAEFLAASDIAMNYRTYFGEVEFEKPIEYREIVLDRYYSPQGLCQSLGIDLETLQEYNLALRPALFKRRLQLPKNLALKIPLEITQDTKVVLANVPAKAASDQESPPTYYKVLRGDQLASIAGRFGVSAKELMEVNELSKNSKLYAGQILSIPSASPVKLAQADTSLKPQTQKTSGPLPPAPAKQDTLKKATEKMPVKPESVVTPKGETLVYYDMKQPPFVSYAADRTRLQSAGSITKSELAMNIFKPALDQPSPMNLFKEEIYDLGIELTADGKAGAIRIGLDETLSHYADWLLVPYKKILQLNGLSGRRTRISIGQKLRIPFSKRSVDDFKRVRLEYHMAIEEDFYGAYRVKGTVTYQVKSGDNVWELGDSESGMPLWLIKKYNPGLELSNLMPGQEILLPEIEEAEK